MRLHVEQDATVHPASESSACSRPHIGAYFQPTRQETTSDQDRRSRSRSSCSARRRRSGFRQSPAGRQSVHPGLRLDAGGRLLEDSSLFRLRSRSPRSQVAQQDTFVPRRSVDQHVVRRRLRRRESLDQPRRTASPRPHRSSRPARRYARSRRRTSMFHRAYRLDAADNSSRELIICSSALTLHSTSQSASRAPPGPPLPSIAHHAIRLRRVDRQPGQRRPSRTRPP